MPPDGDSTNGILFREHIACISMLPQNDKHVKIKIGKITDYDFGCRPGRLESRKIHMALEQAICDQGNI
jgi:hypothetical protein